MQYILIISLLLVTGCSNPYGYKPGSLASEENQRRDLDACRDNAWNKYLDETTYWGRRGSDSLAGIDTPQIPLANYATGIIVGQTIVALTPEDSAKAREKRKDVGPMIDRCMATKGYIYKG